MNQKFHNASGFGIKIFNLIRFWNKNFTFQISNWMFFLFSDFEIISFQKIRSLSKKVFWKKIFELNFLSRLEFEGKNTSRNSRFDSNHPVNPTDISLYCFFEKIYFETKLSLKIRFWVLFFLKKSDFDMKTLQLNKFWNEIFSSSEKLK